MNLINTIIITSCINGAMLFTSPTLNSENIVNTQKVFECSVVDATPSMYSTNKSMSLVIDGYNIEKAERKGVTIFTVAGLDNQSECLKKLKMIAQLGDNWNGNGAKAFSHSLLEKVKSILASLDKQPEIFPTAANSIQLEYEKESGEYLEFNVYEDYIEMFSIDSDERESEKIFGINELEEINKLVGDFCA